MSQHCQVWFRVDAGQGIGLGHLTRSVALASQLRARGCDVQFVTSRPLGPQLKVFAAPYRIWSIESPQPGEPRWEEEASDADRTVAIIGRRNADPSWVVVDHHGLGEIWERKVAEAGHKIMAVDDFRDRTHCADLLVSDIGIPFDPALNARGSTATALTGPRFALIGPEFVYAPEKASNPTSTRRVLVSYGGSDPTGETLKAMRAITLSRERSAASPDAVDVVVGPANAAADEILGAAGAVSGMEVHIGPRSLAPLLRPVCLFLTAGGNSMVEALSMRKPCLVTVTAANQSLVVRQFADEGLIRVAGRAERTTAASLADAISNLLMELDTFEARLASRPVVDHLGPQRVATVMLEDSVGTR